MNFATHFLFARPAVFAVVLAALLGGIASTDAADADVVGEWRVADGSAHVRIAPCGPDLCGVLSWIEAPGTDENNPDPSLRGRSVLGLRILINMARKDGGVWSGSVYNAKDGQTYSAQISLTDSNSLKIEGCVIGGLVCDGETWTRVVGAPARKPPPRRNAR